MDKPKSSKAAARELKVEQRRLRAVELKMEGLPYREIGRILGVSYQTVKNDVDIGLEQLIEERIVATEKYRAIQISRGESVLNKHLPIALDSEHEKCYASLAAVQKQEAFLAKLMGTEQPIQTENKTEVSGMSQGPSVIIEMTEAPEPPEPVDNEEVKDGNSDQSA